MPKKRRKYRTGEVIHGKYTLPPNIHRRLRVEAARLGMSMPEVIKRVLDKHLPRV